jgi:hypothetical protein
MVFLSGRTACKASCNNRLGPIVRAANRRGETGANEATCQNGSQSAGRPPEIATNEANSGSPVASAREETGAMRRTKPTRKPKIQFLLIQIRVRSQSLAAWTFRFNEEGIRGGRFCRRGVAESVPGWAGAPNGWLARAMTASLPYEPDAPASAFLGRIPGEFTRWRVGLVCGARHAIVGRSRRFSPSPRRRSPVESWG